MNRLNRRQFVVRCVSSALGAWVFTACDDVKSSGDLVLEPFDGEARLEFEWVPALRKQGGQTRFSISGIHDKLIAVRTSGSELRVLSRICTHRGCSVNYNAPASRLECPCHGSEFNLAGQILQGPAQVPLAAYQVIFDGTRDFATILLPGLS